MIDYKVNSQDFNINNKKILNQKNIIENRKKEKKINLELFIPDKILIQNFKTESNLQNNIYNKNNNLKLNSNTLTLDLSNEDFTNAILNNNLKQEIDKKKSSLKFNKENNDSILNQNELNSLEIKKQMSPSKIIDEESKSYIKELIENCKFKKGYDLEKISKSNKSKYIKGKQNIYYKDINLKKENYKNIEHIKKLKTEDLIEIAKRRREHLSKNRFNRIEEEFRTNGLKTEHTRQINIDYDIEIDNCTLNKNKTNRINIKKEYLPSFIKSNFTQINHINNKTSQKNKLSNNNKINNVIKNNNNSLKNNLFYLHKQKEINNLNINYKLNFDENFNNRIKTLCQYNNQISNKKFKIINDDDKDKSNNIIKRNRTVLNKDLLIINNENLIKENINSHDKNIKRYKKYKKNINNNNNLTDNYKYAFINNNRSNHNFKSNNYSKFYKLENKSTNIFNILNKNSNSGMNLYTNTYNLRKNKCNHSSKKAKKINNKSANYLSANIQNNNMVKKELYSENKNKVIIAQKLLNTDKEYKKEKGNYRTLINNNLYEREYNKNISHNKSENFLNIKELKLRANESLKLKKIKSNNVNNKKNTITPEIHHQLNKNKFSFYNNKYDNKNFSKQTNSINYLYQKASDIINNNNKLFFGYSPIKNSCNKHNIININNQKHKYNYKKNISKKNYTKIISQRRIDISIKNKENIGLLLNGIKNSSEFRNKIFDIKERDNFSNINITCSKKNCNNENNYKGLIIKKNLYKKINYNKYESIKKRKHES